MENFEKIAGIDAKKELVSEISFLSKLLAGRNEFVKSLSKDEKLRYVVDFLEYKRSLGKDVDSVNVSNSIISGEAFVSTTVGILLRFNDFKAFKYIVERFNFDLNMSNSKEKVIDKLDIECYLEDEFKPLAIIFKEKAIDISEKHKYVQLCIDKGVDVEEKISVDGKKDYIDVFLDSVKKLDDSELVDAFEVFKVVFNSIQEDRRYSRFEESLMGTSENTRVLFDMYRAKVCKEEYDKEWGIEGNESKPLAKAGFGRF